MEILITLAIGAVAGWLAGVIMRGFGFGLIGNIIVGMVGSVVGNFIGNMIVGARALVPGPMWVSTIFWSTLGAVVVLFIIRLVKRA